MKQCCECKKIKSLDEFNKHSTQSDGHQNWCRTCQKVKYSEYRKNNPQIISDKWKRYYQRNQEQMIERTRLYEKSLGTEEYTKRLKTYNKNAKFKRYGISEEEYNHLLEKQKQKCAMCNKTFDKTKPRSIHIDHDHVTGVVRGILCDGCNLFLGRLENPDYLKKVNCAQAYLARQRSRG